MDVSNIKKNGYKLIDYLTDNGYNYSYIARIKSAMNFVLSHETNSWTDYEEVFSDFDAGKTDSWKKQRKSAMNIVRNFDLEGIFPCHNPNSNIQAAKSCFDLLNPEYSAMVLNFQNIHKNGRYSTTTINNLKKQTSSLLYRLQSQGCNHLADATEMQVIRIFFKGDKLIDHGYPKIMIRLIASTDLDDETKERLISYVPPIRRTHKNKSYLTEDECSAIEDVLQNNTDLTIRDRAIGAMLFYTGLRSIDIAMLKMSSVDFSSERISLTQAKTDSTLVIPIRVSYGNLLFDYIEEFRPKVDDEYVFLSLNHPYRHLCSSAVGTGIVNKIYDAAQIRMNPGDVRGTHIFRRNLIVTMLEKKISQPVISAAAGHDSPLSLDPYFSIDFKHLKECALSIEEFPLDDSVLSV